MYRLENLIVVVLCLAIVFAAPHTDDNDNKHNDTENDIFLDNNSRIINGTKATAGQYPYMCSLQKHNERGYAKFCGGTLIHRKWVLTAAHCIIDFAKSGNVSGLYVVCGSTHAYDYIYKPDTTTAQILPANRVYMHQLFGKGNGNDIALIELAQSAQLNQWVQLIAMAPPKYNPIGKFGENIGWGAIHPKDRDNITYDLMAGPGQVLTPDQCLREHGWILTDHQICIFHKESASCSGDSGGPHIHKLETGQVVQVGIVSYGPAVSCSAHAAVFTKVSSFLQWIKDVFRGNYH